MNNTFPKELARVERIFSGVLFAQGVKREDAIAYLDGQDKQDGLKNIAMLLYLTPIRGEGYSDFFGKPMTAPAIVRAYTEALEGYILRTCPDSLAESAGIGAEADKDGGAAPKITTLKLLRLVRARKEYEND